MVNELPDCLFVRSPSESVVERMECLMLNCPRNG